MADGPPRNATPGPSTGYTKPINLVNCGSAPGVIDAGQKARVLRDPKATLHFSAFDPLTASGLDAVLNLRKLSLSTQEEKRQPPKRIVIEISGSGLSSWRFVPRARTEGGVEGEGNWPRVVDLCGKLAFLCQNQWDIYKLDPYYECTVKPIPALSTITLVQNPPPRPTQPTPLRKRSYQNDDTLEDIPKKRVHYDVTMESIRSTEDEDGDDEDDEVAVAEMITDEYRHYRNPVPLTARPKTTPRTLRTRRPPTTPTPAKPMSQAVGPSHSTTHQPHARQSHSMPPESHKKRKELFETNLNTPIKEEDDEVEDEGPKRKRMYRVPSETRRAPSGSPVLTQRELRAKKREREEQKRKRREEEQKARISQRERERIEELMNAVPPSQPQPSWHSYGPGIDRDSSMRGFSDYEDGGMQDDKPPTFTSREEAERAAAIEASRRKLAELEADRPIWESAAMQRKAREEGEEAERRAKLEAKKREEERIRREHERLRREQDAAELQRQREAARKAAERSQRTAERQARRDRWTSGRWSNARAVQRYNETSDLFDMVRFSEDDPLTVEDVPWPTLRHPNSFSLPEDVDWDSVERFFEELKRHMRTQEYIKVVQKSLHRFHPDRWRSRGLFKSIADAEEREYIDVAVNTVSQALAPIWTKVKGLKQA